MEQVVIYLLMVQQFINLKQPYYVQETFSVGNMKKTGLNGYVFGFSIDYDAIAIHDILDIYKYLMKKKWHSIKCLD